MPLSVYEAFACEVPVVSTKSGGIPEVIEDGKTGFLTEIKDSDTLAQSVLKILNNPVLENIITSNALKLVTKNHNLNVMENNYYGFYRSLIYN